LIEEKKQDVEENAERHILRVMIIASLSEHVSLFNNSHAANNAPVQAWTMRMKEPRLIICALLCLQPAMMVGSVSRGNYQKSKKSWLRLTKERKGQQPPPQLHPAALLHRDYLQVRSHNILNGRNPKSAINVLKLNCKKVLKGVFKNA